jgi:acyl-coenzyme A synthetase/AMP-(fatty) acid ligase
LFVPLSSGGKIVLAQNALELQTLPAAGEVRLINTVPSAIRELLRLRAVPSSVQVINLAGEPLSPELVDQIYRETLVRKVFDLYGPTETTTYSTGALRQAGQPATIGRPLANEQVYLLDAFLSPVPIGVPGELFIGGDGVARGYLNRPELTAQKFISHPFKHDARLYRTGDLARWREDGNLEFLGRIDNQVKIRGFRIELGEIEAVLKSHPGIGAAVAIAREDDPGNKRIVAYVEPQAGTTVAAEDLKRLLRTQLPDFMAPSEIIFLKKLPMTPNGKIDSQGIAGARTQIARRADRSRRSTHSCRGTAGCHLARRAAPQTNWGSRQLF